MRWKHFDYIGIVHDKQWHSWALLTGQHVGQHAAVRVSRALTQEWLVILLLLICWWWRPAPSEATPNGLLDGLGCLHQSQYV